MPQGVWMKAALLVGACGLALGAWSCAEPASPADLVGTWRGASAQWSSAVLTVTEDGSVDLEYVDRRGRVHAVSGVLETDFSKTPVALSIRNIPQLPHPLHTVIEFEGRDHLRIAGFASRWRLRPIAFEADEAILLERQRR